MADGMNDGPKTLYDQADDIVDQLDYSPATPPDQSSDQQQPIDEITVTAPRETGRVQVPQNLPNEFQIYGTPDNGEAQFGVPAAMGVIGAASHAWVASGRAPFSVGNLSKSDGSAYDNHDPTGDHTTAVGIDIRPIRKDSRNLSTNYKDPSYDQEATQQLVNTLRATGGVDKIFFNDPQIKGVSPDKPGQGAASQMHDNHLHVRVNPNWVRPPGS